MSRALPTKRKTVKTANTKSSSKGIWKSSSKGIRAAATAALLVTSASALTPLAAPAPVRLLLAGGARATQGYLGVDIRDVNDDEIVVLKLKESRGAEITRVDHDGPAGKAGLRERDVILQMNGQMIEGEEQLRRMLRETPAGRSITLSLSRDGQQQTISIMLADRAVVERQAWEQHLTVRDPGTNAGPLPGAPEARSGRNDPGRSDPARSDPGPHPGFGFLRGGDSQMPRAFSGSMAGSAALMSASGSGAMLETLGPQLAEFFGVAGGAGLLVRSVEPNSPAAVAGMKAGDVVVKVNQIAVANGGDWARLMHENKGKAVNLVVLRDKHEQTLTLTPDGKRRSATEWMDLRGLQGLSVDMLADALPDPAAMLAQMQPMLDRAKLPDGAELGKLLDDAKQAQLSDPVVAQHIEDSLRGLDAEAIGKQMRDVQRQVEQMRHEFGEFGRFGSGPDARMQ